MELTLESVLSADGFLGHLAFALLVISMLSWKIFWLRVGVIASALVGIVYALFALGDPVAFFWQALLLAVNLFQIIRQMLAERSVAFSQEEDRMVQSILRDLSGVEARELIDRGYWLDQPVGEELIREGSAVENLYYLSNGKAEVRSAGKVVGSCSPGDLIGEGTILSSDSATATVIVSEDARLWCIAAPVLRKHLEKNNNVRAVIDRRVADALKSKLRATNVALSKTGGMKN